MILKILKTLPIFSWILVWQVNGLYECCPKENVLFQSNKSCSNNDLNITNINLDCAVKIKFTKEELNNVGYTILTNESMVETESRRRVSYCHSIIGEEEYYNKTFNTIYVICIEPTIEDEFRLRKLEIQGVLTCISAVFVICTIIVYCMVPMLLDLQGICIVHALFGLTFAYIFLSVIQLYSFEDLDSCTAYAYLVYFSFFYLFFWLVALSFHIWRTTVKPNIGLRTVKWPIVYHLFGIGGPLFFLMVLLMAHYSPSQVWDNIRPGFGENSCWFKSRREIWIYFYGPIIILLIFNIVFYLRTVVSMWQLVESNRTKILKYRFKLCVRLCVIMGITWVFEIFTFSLNSEENSITSQVLVFLLDLVNIFQGLSIFLVLVVFRKRVRRAMANRNLCNIPFPSSWRYLEDEEMESGEVKVNGTIVEYNRDLDEEAELK